MNIPIASTEYVQVPVVAKVAGAPYDPTVDAVWMAFMPPGAEPTLPDWHAASWGPSGGSTHYLQCLVGPGVGGVPLPVGSYVVWVKIVDNPETPIRPAGSLEIF